MAMIVGTTFFHMIARLKKAPSPPTRLIIFIIILSLKILLSTISRLPKLIPNFDKVQINKLFGQFRTQYN